MKKILGVILTVFMALCGFAACRNADVSGGNGGVESDGAESGDTETGGTVTPPSSDTQNNVLIAYFSCTDTTAAVARHISEETKGTLYEITPEVPYTADDLKYYSGGRADREQADPQARPAISGSVENPEKYGVVFLGYPIWHGQAPRIISTFLESYDFSGKTVVPFCTSHSSGIGNSDSNLHSLAPAAEWLAGRRFAAGASRNSVAEWIESLTAAQVVLRWHLQRGVVAIPGSSNPEHIRENISVFSFELSETEMNAIAALDRNEKHDWY